MQPQPVPGPITYCSECDYWYEGEVTVREYLENYYDEGTPLEDVDTYTDTRGPCDCTEEDADFTELKQGFKCGSCNKIHGNELAAAMDCCQSSYTIVVPPGATIEFENGRSFSRNNASQYSVETPVYTVKFQDGSSGTYRYQTKIA